MLRTQSSQKHSGTIEVYPVVTSFYIQAADYIKSKLYTTTVTEVGSSNVVRSNDMNASQTYIVNYHRNRYDGNVVRARHLTSCFSPMPVRL